MGVFVQIATKIVANVQIQQFCALDVYKEHSYTLITHVYLVLKIVLSALMVQPVLHVKKDTL